MSYNQAAQPGPTYQPVPAKARNGLATAGFVLGLIGLLGSFIPVINIVGIVIGVVGAVLAAVGLAKAKKLGAGKGLAMSGLILGLLALIIGIVVNVVFAGAVSNAAKDATHTIVTAPAKSGASSSSETPKSDSSFKDGVLATPKMKIEITDHKVIQVGEKGNEYGSKPVIAFWYTTTNLTDNDVSPMDFLFVFTAYQDNNPNAENKLNVGSLPDERFLDSQTEKIKKGGTVENAVAYELDDETTPVDLVASDDLGMTNIGKVTYNLK